MTNFHIKDFGSSSISTYHNDVILNAIEMSRLTLTLTGSEL